MKISVFTFAALGVTALAASASAQVAVSGGFQVGGGVRPVAQPVGQTTGVATVQVQRQWVQPAPTVYVQAEAQPWLEPQAITTQPPPPPQQEVQGALRPGEVWVGGYWRWRDGRYQWVRGHGVRQQAQGQQWRQGSWQNIGGQWQWQPGGWQAGGPMTTTTTPVAVTPGWTQPAATVYVQADSQPWLEPQAVATQPPPPPQQEMQGQGRPGETWVAGYWRWRDGRYQWVRGRWMRPQGQGQQWRQGSWQNVGGQWQWQPGGWQGSGPMTTTTTTTTVTPVAVTPGWTQPAATVYRQADSQPWLEPQAVATQPPPPPQQEMQGRPRPGQTWVAGYWRWRDGRYQWVRGRWMRPQRQGQQWRQGQWENAGGQYRWQPGGWQASAGGSVGFGGGRR